MPDRKQKKSTGVQKVQIVKKPRKVAFPSAKSAVPATRTVKMRYFDTVVMNPGASGTAAAAEYLPSRLSNIRGSLSNSVAGHSDKHPRGFTSMESIYASYEVLEVKSKVTFINNSALNAFPQIASVQSLPTDADSVSTGADDYVVILANKEHSHVILPYGDYGTRTLKKQFKPARIEGTTIGEPELQGSLVGSDVGESTPVKTPKLVVKVQPLQDIRDGNEVYMVIEMDLVVKFFNRVADTAPTSV